jgi:hypothetical protein
VRDPLRFEANTPDAGAPLSEIVRAAVSLAEVPTVAIVTAFRSLPRGKLPVADVVSSWLQPRSVLSVVHLLRDARPLEGAGESEFQRGLGWIFPIAAGGAA